MAVSVERVGRTPAIYQGDHDTLFFFFFPLLWNYSRTNQRFPSNYRDFRCDDYELPGFYCILKSINQGNLSQYYLF